MTAKNVFIWIAGFVCGVICFLIGNALMLFVDQLLFNYANYWLAAIIGVIFTLGSIYKIVDYSVFIVPYVLIKNTSISIFYVLFFLIISMCLFSLFNHSYFNNLSSIPKWLYITMQFFFMAAAISLINIVKRFILEKQVEREIRRELREKYPNAF